MCSQSSQPQGNVAEESPSNDTTDSLTLYLAQQLINQSNSEIQLGTYKEKKKGCFTAFLDAVLAALTSLEKVLNHQLRWSMEVKSSYAHSSALNNSTYPKKII